MSRSDKIASTAASFQVLYRRLAELEGVKQAISKRMRRRDHAGIVPLRRQYPGFEGELMRLQRGARALATIRRQRVTPVFENQVMSPKAKREALDRVYEQMVDVARAALRRERLPDIRQNETVGPQTIGVTR